MEPKLKEKDFIHDDLSKNPYPALFWFLIIAIFAGLVWGLFSFLQQERNKNIENKPFFQVTNREFSLFLWQNPHLMRAHVRGQTGYLKGFLYEGEIGVDPKMAEEFVSAPADILFLYHVWNRLLGDITFERKISHQEFIEFLHQAKQWRPIYWKKAPKSYVILVNKLMGKEIGPLALQDVPKDLQYVLPKIVKKAFTGWKNYFKEGKKINNISITYKELEVFLNKYPTYARNYWRNIFLESHPNYLKTFTTKQYLPNEFVETDELSHLLKIAIYNEKAK